MTTLTADASIQECVNALAAVEDTANSIDPDGQIERKINKVIALSGGSYTTYLRKIMEDAKREFQEAYQKILVWAESMHDQIQHITKHALHRTQGRSSSKGKTSAKKSASASGGNGGNGGDSGGDGDGPHRTRSNQQRRSSKTRSTQLKRPPRTSSGVIAVTSSPKSKPPTPPHGQGLTAFLVVILLIFVIVLLYMNERDMAWSILGPLGAALISYIKPPGRKH